MKLNICYFATENGHRRIFHEEFTEEDLRQWAEEKHERETHVADDFAVESATIVEIVGI